MAAPHRNRVAPRAQSDPQPLGLRIMPSPPAGASFLGLAAEGPLDRAVTCSSYTDFVRAFTHAERSAGGPHVEGGSLAHAVRGFFANGGARCLVARAAEATVDAHLAALDLLTPLAGGTSLVAPDAQLLASGTGVLHRALIDEAERTTGAIALLDPPDGLSSTEVIRWRSSALGDTSAGVLAWPWVSVPGMRDGALTPAPSSGWVAGVWARTDADQGPDRAATGQVVLAVEGIRAEVDAHAQHALNRAGVTPLRAWPGPEPRLWGGRSLSADACFCHVHQRRLVAHLATSVADGTAAVSIHADDPAVRERMRLGILTFLGTWWRRGALQGATPGQAFHASCEYGDDGLVIELGLALRRPSDHHLVRISRAG